MRSRSPQRPPDALLEVAPFAQRPLHAGRTDLQLVRPIREVLEVEASGQRFGHLGDGVEINATLAVDRDPQDRPALLATKFHVPELEPGRFDHRPDHLLDGSSICRTHRAHPPRGDDVRALPLAHLLSAPSKKKVGASPLRVTTAPFAENEYSRQRFVRRHQAFVARSAVTYSARR